MTAQRAEPFVSGLSRAEPGTDPAPASPNPRGYAMLVAIRERAQADMKLYEPATKKRFDGEWREPDKFAIEEYELSAVTKTLIDAIVSDREICVALCLRLAHRQRRRRP